MNNIEIFNNEEFGQIRTIVENDKILFCASDVAKALGYEKPNNAINTHCKNATLVQGIITDSLGRKQNANFIPEGDVYRLIIRSKLPSAERFESWVFDEVLPSIRKTGSYQTQKMSSAEILLRSAQLLYDHEQKLKEQNERLTKVESNVNSVKELESIAKDNWKQKSKVIINKMAKGRTLKDGENPYESIYTELYKRLEAEMRCNLTVRLKNMKERARLSGASKSYINKLGKLDAIGEDTRLITGFLSVLKKMNIQCWV